jgi:hypothetical protein
VGQSGGHTVAVCFHYSGVIPPGDAVMTSRNTRTGPVGLKPNIMVGSTTPRLYPRTTVARLLEACNSSPIPTLSSGTLLSANRTACRVLVCGSRCSPGLSRLGHATVTSCGPCCEPARGSRKQGAILRAQLAGNQARSAEAPLTRLTPACSLSAAA